MSSSDPSSSDEEEISESEASSGEELSWWDERLLLIKENDPGVKSIASYGNDGHIQNMTDEEWEELGRDIASNTHLTDVYLCSEALNDHKISCLFRGLTRSNTLKHLDLCSKIPRAVGVRSMVPFLQNANNLIKLDLGFNNILSEGFKILLRALSDSPIEELRCNDCGIESIGFDNELMLKNLKFLRLYDNIINTDGCRGLVKLLQRRHATLESLSLQRNKIGDDGVEILVDALRSNTSLRELYLSGNYAISKRGMIMMLKLVNDISSIEATLQSNHTLTQFYYTEPHVVESFVDDQIQKLLDTSADINRNADSPEAAGREKVIRTQLHSERRAELADIQGVTHSVYGEIETLYLPEVLSLISKRNGEKELFPSLKSSMVGLLSRVDMKLCIQKQVAYHTARLKELGNRLAVIEDAEESTESVESESRSIKRRRKWWWGLWGRT